MRIDHRVDLDHLVAHDVGVNAPRRVGGFVAAINVKNGGAFNGFPANATRIITPHTRGDLLDRVKAAVADENSGNGVGVYYVNKKAITNIEPVELHNELASLKRNGFINSILDPASPVHTVNIIARYR